MKILIAEDDLYTKNALVEILENEGFEIISTDNGDGALDLFKNENPDLVCLDIMMPGKNGYDVCKEIRKVNQEIPVIFLSAKSEEIDKVLGLELGADDYISKPFGVKEVIARIRAVLRRTNLKNKETIEDAFKIGIYIISQSELKAKTENTEIELTLRDVKILKLFSDNKGKVLNRDQIYNVGWGSSHFPNSRTLDQHISQLRKKIENDPKNPEIIVTVHTAGYRYA